MTIKIEHLAELNLINFHLPQALTAVQNFVVGNTSCLPQSALAQQLLEIEGVERCLIADTLIGIKYANAAKADEITALVLAEIDDYMAIKPSLIVGESALPLLAQIEALADSFIRPTLLRDNGNIQIMSVTQGVVQIQFTGHCAGCPYAQSTLNNVIAAVLKKYLPQIQNVRMEEN